MLSGVLSTLAGLVEAAVFVGLARLALSIATSSALAQPFPLLDRSFSALGLLLVLVMLSVLRLVLALAATLLNARLYADARSRVAKTAIDAYLSSPWELRVREREGGLQQLASLETDRAAHAVGALTALLTVLCPLVATLAAAVLTSPLMAAVTIAGLGALAVALRPVARRARRHAYSRSSHDEVLANTINETERLALDIAAFGVATRFGERLSEMVDDARRPNRRLAFLANSVPTIYQTLAVILLIGCCGVAQTLSDDQVADLGATVLLLLRAFGYSQQAQVALHGLSEQRATLDIINTKLARLRSNDEQAADDLSHPQDLTSVRLEDVSYRYPNGAGGVCGLNVEIRVGEILGVTGPSGAGKTTFVLLLLRLLAPTSGQLVSEGVPLHTSSAAWSRHAAFLPQDPEMLEASVADNIRFERPWVTDADVRSAAEAAGIRDAIEALPEGFNTRVGPSTDAMSGGQRQRICLARALAGRPQLLILDEPMSALDLESEHVVRATLDRLRQTMAIVLISHSPATLTLVDRLLVLHGGRLTFDGPYSQAGVADGYVSSILESAQRDALDLRPLPGTEFERHALRP